MKEIAEWVNARDFKTWFKDERAELYPVSRRSATAPSGAGQCDQSASGTHPAARQQVADQPRFFADGVPDSYRKPLLKIDGAAALAYEVLTEGLRAGCIDPDHITVGALLEAVAAMGWGVNDATIRRGVKTLAGVFFADLPTDQRDDSTAGNFAKNSKAGRTAASWQLITLSQARARLLYAVAPRIVENAYPAEDTPLQPAVIAPLSVRALADAGIADTEAARELWQVDQQLPLDERAKWTGKRVEKQYRQLADRLDDLHSTPLALAGEDWKPRDPGMYRVCYLRARKIADPNSLRSNREIADELGLKSPKTAAAVVRRAGLQVHGEQFETRQITRAANVEQQVNKIARFDVQGKPRYIEVQTADTTREIPYSAAELTRQIERGATVSVKFQVANRHEVIADAKPVERTRCIRQIESVADQPITPAKAVVSEQQPRVRLTAPRAEAEPTMGYTPEWVRAQIALRLRRRKWQRGGMFVNPHSGEMVSMSAPADVLLSLLLGRDVQLAENTELGADDLFVFALQEFGDAVRGKKLG